ncbi:MAG: arylsulfatase [Acidobacteria bacterium]|nr:arylsulfatase [Acidobacteriota bacterium]
MKTRREFLQTTAAAAAAAAIDRTATASAPASSLAKSRPNIILILADDMGYSDIGPFGSEIDTPNLDRLASNGMVMNQFYNSPRCCPSRAALLTGLYSHQAGMGMMTSDYGRYPFPAYAGNLSKQTITIPEALKTVGYKTAMTGKWHLTQEKDKTDKSNWPCQRGFDKFWGMTAGASVYFNPGALIEQNTPLPEPDKKTFYYTDAIADHAVNYIDELAKGKDPFFLYCAFNAPHWPIQAPEHTIEKYAKRYAEGWDRLREERHKRQIEKGIVDARWELTPRDPRVPAWEKASFKDWEMRRYAVYAAIVDHIDQGIGRILKKLEERSALDNTLIVFMADNGGNAEEMGQMAPLKGRPNVYQGNDPKVMPGSWKTYQSIGIPWGNCCNTPFRLYKHYAHEGGISSPFVAHWPKGIKPQAKPNPNIAHETDLMPTFLELAGATYPKSVAAGPIPEMVGQSLTPVFEHKLRSRGPIFWEHEGNKAVRFDRWKLVSRFPDGWELYNMEEDRTEMHDVAHQNEPRVKRMIAMWDDWAAKVGVQPWPMPQTPPRERTGEMRTPEYLKVDEPKH